MQHKIERLKNALQAHRVATEEKEQARASMILELCKMVEMCGSVSYAQEDEMNVIEVGFRERKSTFPVEVIFDGKIELKFQNDNCTLRRRDVKTYEDVEYIIRAIHMMTEGE